MQPFSFTPATPAAHAGLPARPDRPPRAARAAAQVRQTDARMARLALLRSDLAPVAAGSFSLVREGADCRFLLDVLAAAPATLEACT